MRILLVYPGALFSTLDVANGYFNAFKQMPDVKLFTFQFHKYLIYHDIAQQAIFKEEYNKDKVMEAASKDLIIRILECRPDWVVFISGLAFPTFVWDFVSTLQGDLKNKFSTSVLLTESPYVEEWEKGILARVDVAFTTDYGILDEYRQVNTNLYYLRHCYDPSVHYWAGQPKDIGLFFVGTGFPERQRLLEDADWSGVDLRLFGNWMYLTAESSLQPYLKGENLANAETAEKYRASKMALNIFRTVQWPDDNPKFIEPSRAKSLSPRCYEAMACNSVLFTDWREELDDFPKDSYVLWGDAKELEAKAKWFLSHDSERERIAAKGMDVVKPHTFDQRARELLNHLKEHI